MPRLIVLMVALMAFFGCTGLSGEPQIVATVARPPARPTPEASTWQPDIVNGARIFAQRCVDCHGATGDGQGELVVAGSVSPPLDMTDRELVALKSPLEFYEIISEGRLENLMPPWQDSLTESERWDLALYSYSLSYDADLLALGEALWLERCGDCDMPPLIPPVYSDAQYAQQLNSGSFGGALTAREASAAAAYLRMTRLLAAEADSAPGDAIALGSINGRLAHGTAGGIVPPDTLVQLQYGNAELGYKQMQTSLADGFSFRFDDVPIGESYSYVVGAMYRGRVFSRRLRSSALSEITIALYDLTDDPAMLSVSRIDLVIDAVKLADLGAGLTITQRIGIRNRSDRLFTSGRRFDDGREAVLLLQFPQGARLISGDANGRLVVVEDMDDIPDSVIDTRPVPPGDSHQLVLEYFLPYAGEVLLEQSFNYALEADLSVTMLERLGIAGEQTQLEESGAAGDGFRSYRGRLDIEKQPRLRLRVSGDPFATSSDDRAIVTAESLGSVTALAAGIAGALLAGAGFVTMRRRRRAGSEINRLVAELARLDEDHDQGRINHDLYHHRRRELKARLAQLMAADK